MRSERVAARVTARACPFDSCTDSRRHHDVPVIVARVAEVAEAVVCRLGVADQCVVRRCGQVPRVALSSCPLLSSGFGSSRMGQRGGPLLAVLFCSLCRSGSAYPGAAAAVRLYR